MGWVGWALNKLAASSVFALFVVLLALKLFPLTSPQQANGLGWYPEFNKGEWVVIWLHKEFANKGRLDEISMAWRVAEGVTCLICRDNRSGGCTTAALPRTPT